MKNIDIPVTGVIMLERDEGSWRALELGIFKEFRTFGVIVDVDEDEETGVSIVLNKVFTPENLNVKTTLEYQTEIDGSSGASLSRIKGFFEGFINKVVWIFMGYIEGKEEIPIVILYYEQIDTMIYTKKLSSEKITEFHSDPNLN